MKSEKNIVRDILKAQGLQWDIEPTTEAIQVLQQYGSARCNEGWSEAWHEAENYN